MQRTFARAIPAVVAIACALPACGDDSGDRAQPEQHGAPAAVLPPAAAATEDAALVVSGRRAFQRRGCTACHGLDGSAGMGPALKGQAGVARTLKSGATVTFDAAWLRTTLTDESRSTVKGYAAIMPFYGDKLDAAEVDALVAYMLSLE